MIRRDILKYTFGFGSILALHPRILLSNINSHLFNTLQTNPKVAVILPNNYNSPASLSFIKGLLSKVTTTNISILSLPSAISDKQQYITQYLAKYNPDIFLLLSPTPTDSRFINQFVSKNIPVVNVSLGDKINNTLSDSQVYSLQSWQSNYSLGKYAFNSVGKNALVITSQNDSGYDCYQSLIHGFTESGGTIEHTIIADADTSTSGLENSQLSTAVFNSFRQAQVDCILLHCSGINLEKTLSFIIHNDITLPIFASFQSVSGATTSVKKLLDKVSLTTVVPDLFHNTNSRFASNAINSWNLFELLGNNIGHIIANTQPQTLTSELMQVNTQNKFIVIKIDNQFFNGRGFPSSVISRLSTETQDVVYALKGIHTMPSGNLSPYLMA